MPTRAERLQGTMERRAAALPNFELRSVTDGALQFSGLPALFDQPYEMYGGPEKGGWMERVNPKAFDRTLGNKPDVSLNVDHGDSLSGLPIARTTAPGPMARLMLGVESSGMRAKAALDPTADDDVRTLQQKMNLGLVKQMSYAFRTIRQAWNDDETERELLELDLNRGDVSIVTNGANASTSSSLRGIEDALDILAGAELSEMRSAGTDKLIAVHRALTVATGKELRSVDDNAGDIAAAVDAAVDAALGYLNGGQIAQGIAVLGAAELSIDALLAMLGVPDADDETDPQMNAATVPLEQRQRLSLAHAKRLMLLDA